MNYTCSNEIVWSPIDGGVLIVRPADGQAWAMNGTGAALWEFCETGSDTNAIAESLAVATGWGKERAKQETTAFIEELEVHRLIRPSGRAPTGGVPVISAKSIPFPVESPAVAQVKLSSKPNGKRPSPRGVSGPV